MCVQIEENKLYSFWDKLYCVDLSKAAIDRAVVSACLISQQII